MGMPEIPDGKNRPSMDETVIDLLESIALEEIALSHILNAQGEKLQHTVDRGKKNQIHINEIEKAFKSTNKTLVNVIMKEWLLMVKMDNVESLIETKHQSHCRGKE